MALSTGSSFVPGDVCRLSDDYGVGPGSLLSGSEVSITGIHAPGTPGLGYSEDDTITADYVDPDGTVRTIALCVPEFSALFRKVS